MLADNTTNYKIPTTRTWLGAAVAATCCLIPPTVHAERETIRRQRVEHHISTSTLGLLGGAGGEVSVVDDHMVMYLDKVLEPSSETRATTEQERTIAVLREWKNYPKNWDGEGAQAPIARSIDQAGNFVCGLQQNAIIPEPMLHETGRAGLFWKENDLYADLEFLDEDKIAYYIEKGSSRHKGVVDFDGQHIPEVFTVLLNA